MFFCEKEGDEDVWRTTNIIESPIGRRAVRPVSGLANTSRPPIGKLRHTLSTKAATSAVETYQLGHFAET